MAVGRFAPSPTGELHLGNLRTAVVAWLFARSAGSTFILRVEDLDPSTRTGEHEAGQLADLRALGINWDGPTERQSARFELYNNALRHLIDLGRTYECFCSRREVRAAAQAAHGPVSHSPGTCRDLSAAERTSRRNTGRPAATRLRGEASQHVFVDRIAGRYEGIADDVVIRRNDGTPAYNLAVVVDDADQGIGEVVRGDDLLGSTPAQMALAEALELTQQTYVHVPLAYGPGGDRLAKRDGAVTLGDLKALGVDASDVLKRMLDSIFDGDGGPSNLNEALAMFDPDQIAWRPWKVSAEVIQAPVDR